MSAFLDPLQLELMRDPQGRPLLTRDGRQLWRMLARFRYQSDVVAADRQASGIAEPDPAVPGLMETPVGFVTDLCSKPQIALALMGDNEQEASLPHDLAYSTHCIPRDVADRMLYEACVLTGTPRWRAALIYAGVRVGGGSHWEPNS
jgi:hypothetical protein